LNPFVKLPAAATALSVLLTGLAYAYQFNSGALTTDTQAEDKLSFGGAAKFSLRRDQLQIPRGYGRLVAITPTGKTAVLWFESETGVIRNVAVNGATPLLIERKGALD
jgi:hypothetical protein